MKKIRTLIVDDQLIQREVLRRMLKNEADIEIIGTPAKRSRPSTHSIPISF